MTWALYVAAALTLAISAAHSYLGERYILMRLFRREDLPRLLGSADFTKQTLRIAWHITSVAFVGLGVLMLQLTGALGGHSPQSTARVIGATFLVSAVVALLGTRGRHYSWIGFGVIALVLLVAGR